MRFKDLIFMQDRAPPHFAVVAREWRNARFPGKRMSCRGSHEWPAKSPNLTVNILRLCLWGCLKEQVCVTNQEIWKSLKGEYVKF